MYVADNAKCIKGIGWNPRSKRDLEGDCDRGEVSLI